MREEQDGGGVKQRGSRGVGERREREGRRYAYAYILLL